MGDACRKKVLGKIVDSITSEYVFFIQKVEYGNIFWDTLIQASITKYIIVNLQTLVLYDVKMSKKAQIKEVLSIGIKYTFF